MVGELALGNRDGAGPASGANGVTIFVGLAIAVVLVVALGGRLGNLGSVELRGKPAVIGAFLLQLLVVTVAPHAFSHAVASGIHLASYALAIVFVYANRHLPNLWIAALGGTSNFIAITANGGTMPASKTALAAAGLRVTRDGFDNCPRFPALDRLLHRSGCRDAASATEITPQSTSAVNGQGLTSR